MKNYIDETQMAGYQSLQKYQGNMYGTPTWNGIEYDWEVPDNMVIASPGGVSSTQHHYTKGFYGEGGSSWDNYGGEAARYVSGTRGNLYQMGQTSTEQQGIFTSPIPDPPDTATQSSPPIRDAFQYTMSIPGQHPQGPPRPGGSSTEFIPPPDTLETTPAKLKFSLNPFLLFVVLLILYLVYDYFSSGVENLVQVKFYGGRPFTWKQYFIFGVVFLVLLIALVYWTGSSLVQVERL